MMDFDGLCAYLKVHFPNSFSIGDPMKDHTTFANGGPADLFVTVREAKALQALLKKARDCDVPYLILGKGSNMLVRDGGIRGLVVHLDEGGAQLVTGYELRAGGGCPWTGRPHVCHRYSRQPWRCRAHECRCLWRGNERCHQGSDLP